MLIVMIQCRDRQYVTLKKALSTHQSIVVNFESIVRSANDWKQHQTVDETMCGIFKTHLSFIVHMVSMIFLFLKRHRWAYKTCECCSQSMDLMSILWKRPWLSSCEHWISYIPMHRLSILVWLRSFTQFYWLTNHCQVYIPETCSLVLMMSIMITYSNDLKTCKWNPPWLANQSVTPDGTIYRTRMLLPKEGPMLLSVILAESERYIL